MAECLTGCVKPKVFVDYNKPCPVPHWAGLASHVNKAKVGVASPIPV